jgi:hypothetical protein
MAYLNANIPVEYAQIRREYLYDLKKHHGEVEDCIIFGVTCITGRALLFHAIMENGAIFYRLPITAFIQRGFKPEDVPIRRLDIQSLIYLTLIIQKFRTNISAHTYLH